METTVTPSKVALKYGLLTAAVLIIYSMILQFAGLGTNTYLGLLSYAILIGGIVLAQMNFKSSNNNSMTYGQGLGLGTLLSVVAALISSIFSYIYIKFIDDSLLVQMRDKAISDMEAKGNMSDEQIEQAVGMMDMMMKPETMVIFGVVGLTLAGFIISLIVSAILKKDPVRFNTLDAG